MGKQTEIEWCDATWNPWYGCQKVSAGCKLCYAERDMTRYGREFSKVTRAAPATFRAPLRWKEPRRIFTCSWSDFFIAEADPWRAEAWEIIRQTPQHTYLILTKRVDRVCGTGVSPVAGHGQDGRATLLPWRPGEQPWPHVWLGVSAENQQQADKRIPLLLSLPRPSPVVQFVSYEPALERIIWRTEWFTWPPKPGSFPGTIQNPKPGIDCLIIGGESARPRSRARPFHLEWAFDALAQCRAAGVPCFIKQLGSNPYYHGQPLKLRDWKGGDMTEWPEELRVREFPERETMNAER